MVTIASLKPNAADEPHTPSYLAIVDVIHIIIYRLIFPLDGKGTTVY
jgi:hypothetical protein